MDSILRFALTNAVLALGLALVAFALSIVARRPALSHVLWVLVLIKLLSPPALTLPLQLHRGTERTTEPSAVDPPAPVATSSPIQAKADGPARSVVKARPWASWSSFGLVLWLTGSAVVAGLVVMRLRQFRRVLRCTTLAPAAIQAQAGALSARIGIPRCPPVEFLPGPICPMVWGAFGSPRIILPSQLWRDLSPGKQSSLLLHELAHVRRRDHWVRPLETLATIFFWWNPVLWWARHELRKAEEQCCDAWVTWAAPGRNEDYAAALIEAVGFLSSGRWRPGGRLPALASGIGEFRNLKRRLIMIQSGTHRRNLGTSGLIVSGLVATLLPVSLSGADGPGDNVAQTPSSVSSSHDRPATQPASGLAPPVEAQLGRVLPDVRFDSVGLSDVMDFLRDVSGANIAVDWKSLEAAGIDRSSPVSARLRDVKFSKVLSVILVDAGGPKAKLGYKVDGGVITISTLTDLEESLVVRSYDVKDLIAGPDPGGKTKSLIQMITGSVAKPSWTENGGPAGAIKELNGQLIVTQTPENQEAVANLLKTARQLVSGAKSP